MTTEEGEEAANAAMKDDDRLGRLLIRSLAFLGGLAGFVVAALQLLGSLIGSSSSHIPGGWSDLGWAGGAMFLLLSLAGNGSAPFRTVLTHGFVVNPDRAKFSKSNQASYQKPPTVENFVH